MKKGKIPWKDATSLISIVSKPIIIGVVFVVIDVVFVKKKS